MADGRWDNQASPELTKVRSILRGRRDPAPASSAPADPVVLRQQLESAALPVAPDIEVTAMEIAGVPVERLTPVDASPDVAVLYLHGGGFCLGSPATHRKLVGDIARAIGAPCFTVDYRLAPEHPLPAAIEDLVAVYGALSRDLGGASVLVAGDSAGASLAVLGMVAAREAGLDRPAGAVLLTPWVDYLCADQDYVDLAHEDPVTAVDQLASYRHWFLDGDDPTDPRVCAAAADLRGLPPLLIHAGGGDVMRSDSAWLAQSARKAGVDVTHRQVPGGTHVWHVFAGRVPESTEAVEEIGWFARRLLALT